MSEHKTAALRPMHTASLKHFTLRRKAALVFAAVWVPTFFIYFFPKATQASPADWAPLAVLIAGGYSAYTLAVILVEVMRMALPHTGIHNDETHFHRVWVVFVTLLALAGVAYLAVVALTTGR